MKTHWQPSYTPPQITPEAAAYKRRESNLSCETVRKTFDAIHKTPGVTGGDLIRIVKITSAGSYAKMLLDAGEIEAIFQRTKAHQQTKGVRHFYPIGYLKQQGIAT